MVNLADPTVDTEFTSGDISSGHQPAASAVPEADHHLNNWALRFCKGTKLEENRCVGDTAPEVSDSSSFKPSEWQRF